VELSPCLGRLVAHLLYSNRLSQTAVMASLGYQGRRELWMAFSGRRGRRSRLPFLALLPLGFADVPLVVFDVDVARSRTRPEGGGAVVGA